ncbi:MAG: phosphocholine cytidylyltransferase family protein [Acidobacteria bacterium]|nr:phosphocholine cytidylyltransferase family protein [Acidobacteriota bacterium]
MNRGPMRVVIMAAGVGSRLEALAENRPKCLIRIGEQSLISRMLDQLSSRGLSDVTIVTGFRSELVEEEVRGRARVVRNPFYHLTNSIASLWLAREFLGPETIVANGDICCNIGLLDELISDHRDPVMLCDSSRIATADYRFSLDGERLVAFGKHIPAEKTDAEYVGMAKISHAFMPRFKARLDQLVGSRMCGLWWEDVLYSHVSEGVPIYCHDVAGHFWSEIDHAGDWARVMEWLRAGGAAPVPV